MQLFSTLNEIQITSRACLDLYIQILHSNVAQSVADFYNKSLTELSDSKWIEIATTLLYMWGSLNLVI